MWGRIHLQLSFDLIWMCMGDGVLLKFDTFLGFCLGFSSLYLFDRDFLFTFLTGSGWRNLFWTGGRLGLCLRNKMSPQPSEGSNMIQSDAIWYNIIKHIYLKTLSQLFVDDWTSSWGFLIFFLLLLGFCFDLSSPSFVPLIEPRPFFIDLFCK